MCRDRDRLIEWLADEREPVGKVGLLADNGVGIVIEVRGFSVGKIHLLHKNPGLDGRP